MLRRSVVVSGALEDGWAGDGVCAALVVWGSGGVVDLGEDTGVIGRVGTWEGDGVGGASVGSRASDVDLSALHVELSLAADAGRMESDELSTEEVVSWGNAGWNVKVLPSSSLDHLVNTPLATLKTVLVDLEPLEAGGAGGGGVVDLGEVDDGWTLVGGSDWVVWVVGALRTANDVTPPGTNSSTSWDVDDVVVLVNKIRVACKVGVVDVLDWVVGGWGSDTLELSLVLSVDGNLLENGVSLNGSEAGKGDGKKGGELHVEH